MPTEPELPSKVQDEVGATILALRAAGWKVTASQCYEQVMGNWFIDLARNGRTIRLIKDRSQYMIDGPIEQLKAAGLFKAFDELNAFHEAVVAWATKP